MAQGKVPDEELNGVTGGRIDSVGESVQVYCKVLGDDFDSYLNQQGEENDCPYFVAESGGFRRCDCCANLETKSGAAVDSG